MNKLDFALKIKVSSPNGSLYMPDILYVGAAMVEDFMKLKLIAGA
jgi:hypothetical protein